MDAHDIEILKEFFKTEPIRTRGTAEGIIVKGRRKQIKIYDGRNGTYQIQAFKNGSTIPYLVDEIPTHSLREYIARLYE